MIEKDYSELLPAPQKYKILIFGAGVIGSIYGGLLSKSGHDVTLLARGKRFKELKQNGLLLSKNNRSVERYEVEIISELNVNDIYDFVFVTLRNDHIAEALPILAENKSRNFVFMINNANGFSDWEKILGENRVISAFPGAGGKIENSIVHYNLTTRLVQPTTFGEINGAITKRIISLKQILKHAGFPTAISTNMDSWQKTHLALVCPLAYGIYFDGGNNYTFSKNKKAVEQTCKALKETFSFINNSDIALTPSKFHLIRLAPMFILKFVMPKIYNTKWAETLISNHALAAKNEMELLTKEFISLAKNRGIELNEINSRSKIRISDYF